VLDGVVYDIHTPANSTVMAGNSTEYLGVYWCYGALTVDSSAHTLSCDGSSVSNFTQSDSLSADIRFYVEQARNNSSFVCPTSVRTVAVLDNKDAIWNPIEDGMRGVLRFMSEAPTFDFDLTVSGLTASTSYTLLYYADPWPGTNGVEIDTFVTDGSGNAIVSNSVELGMNLPVPVDANYPTGAKIWVIPSIDWDGTQMIDWNPSMYLFDLGLVSYTDLP